MSQDQQNKEPYKKYEHNYFVYDLNECDKTANITFHYPSKSNVLIPRFIYFETQKYYVTKINSYAFKCSHIVKCIEFPPDSEIRTIEKDSFSNSEIESIFIPAKLVELEEGWCCATPKLTSVRISSDNKRYSIYDDKFIIGKSTLDKSNHDVLVFCVRNVEKVTIPSFIETIGPYAFNECHDLKKVEILPDSKLKIIDCHAFCNCSIQSFYVPHHVTHINECAFSSCNNLSQIGFHPDSQIQKFEQYLFAFCSIERISIPRHVKSIGEYVFLRNPLKVIEFPENSELQTIENFAFYNSSIECISIPSNVINLDKRWSERSNKLKCIKIDPNNKRYSVFEDKFLIGKSKIEKENYEVLNLCIQNDEIVTIPSFIEIIQSFAFRKCSQIKTLEFQNNSKLQKIEDCALYDSTIESIYIPSSVTEFDKGWCNCTPKLTQIAVSPLNKIYKLFDDKFILKKSNIESENYDVLIFAVRNIKEATIPSFIESIGAYAFEQCFSLRTVKISSDSKLKIIEKYAFSFTSIKRISIPPHVTKIKRNAFASCQNFEIIEFDSKSELLSIGRDSFIYSSIRSIYIPPRVKQLKSLIYLEKLQIIELDENSEIHEISSSLFFEYYDVIVMIPVNLVDINIL